MKSVDKDVVMTPLNLVKREFGDPSEDMLFLEGSVDLVILDVFGTVHDDLEAWFEKCGWEMHPFDS